MNVLKKWALNFDRIFEGFALVSMCLMTIVVVVQVVTRRLFGFVFHWSEELTLLLVVWFAFMGIAIGFRERIHINMSSIKNLLPGFMQIWLDKITQLFVLGFGVYLIYYGWEFTQLMSMNRLPATQWPLSIQYVIMPISGVMIVIYSALQLFGIKTERDNDLETTEEQP